MEEKDLSKKSKRKYAYIGIVGGLAVVTLACFMVAQFYKAKLKASETQVLASKNILDTIGWDAVDDESSIYHDKALWYVDIYNHFTAESSKNNAVYLVTSISAYTLSILTLVSFGLVLKDADKQKELEEKQQRNGFGHFSFVMI